MTEKRKISVRKVLQFMVTIIVVAGCAVAVTSASRRQEDKKVKGVNIRVTNEKSCHFLDKEEVTKMLLTRRNVDITSLPLSKVDVHQMERIAQSNPWVDAAEVFVDNAAVLHINISQRVPVLRIFESDGSSYYLDTALKTLPLSLHYTEYVPVVTGVPPLKEDSAGKVLKGQILALSSFIAKDTFWNAQIAEISLNADRQFELVPVLGKHRILIGDTSRLANKFSNLFAFYKKVLNRIGWDKYEVLDLRFNSQVVAAPALAWKAPVDRALSNMNWVKSIVGEDDGKDDAPPAAVTTIPRTPATVTPAAVVPAPVKAAAPVPKPVTVVKNNNVPTAKPVQKSPVVKKPVPQAKPVPKKDAAKPTAKKPTGPTAAKPAAGTAKPTGQATKAKEQQKKEEPRKPKYIYQDNH